MGESISTINDIVFETIRSFNQEGHKPTKSEIQAQLCLPTNLVSNRISALKRDGKVFYKDGLKCI